MLGDAWRHLAVLGGAWRHLFEHLFRGTFSKEGSEVKVVRVGLATTTENEICHCLSLKTKKFFFPPVPHPLSLSLCIDEC